jgi:hypothetical protein
MCSAEFNLLLMTFATINIYKHGRSTYIRALIHLFYSNFATQTRYFFFAFNVILQSLTIVNISNVKQ